MSIHKACIIGAGACGLVAAKVLHERGIPFDCFERGSDIGGLWRYENDSGRSSAYASLHMNTSRTRVAFSNFPMPAHYPDFPHHSQVLEYFEAYVERFGFRPAITFRTHVEHVARRDDDTYDVTVRHLDTGQVETRRYGAVLVANGHHWDAYRPAFPGTFDGAELHSHDYKTPDVLEGRRVLIVGVGNSGCDIACEATRVAERVLLATRRGAHVIPKYLLGRPLDLYVTPFGSRLPVAVQRLVYRLIVYLTRGSQTKYGFPLPSHRLGEAHPTISQHLLALVRDGEIQVKPNIERLASDRVVFEDDTEEMVDCIVYATGYNVSFPFFDDDLLSVDENRLPLFRHVMPPAVPNLYFIGLVQPLGAIMPIAEAQAEWIADLLEGQVGLPGTEAMEAAIRDAEAEAEARYVHSRRHTMEIDLYPYLRALAAERKQGRRRAPNRKLPAGASTSPAKPHAVAMDG